ncbi:MAG: hypothetical protein ACK46C_14155, partial [Flavobacteriales bacterium]
DRTQVKAGYEVFGLVRAAAFPFEEQMADPMMDSAAAVVADTALWVPVDTTVPVIEPHNLKRP